MTDRPAVSGPIAAYLDALSPERRGKVEQVIAAVRAVAPDATGAIEYKMPYFRVGERYLGVASQKSYVSVYCGKDASEELKAASPRAKSGGGCVNYPDGVPIPPDALLQAVRRRLG